MQHPLVFGAAGFKAALELVARIVPVDRFVSQDETDHISGVHHGAASREIQRQIEARVQQQRREQRSGDLAFERVVALILFEHRVDTLLQDVVAHGPTVRLIDLLTGAQRGENRRIRTRMNGLHERDIRVHGLLVFGARMLDLADFADGGLRGVEQREPGEHAHGGGAFALAERTPVGHVV